MANGYYVSNEERTRIVDLLHEHGGNRNRVAKIVKRSVGTIQRIACAEGLDSLHSTPEKTNAARRAHAETDRLKILDKGLKKGSDLLDEVNGPRAYKDIMTGIAIGIDKYRLETGQVTDRTESRKGQELPDFFKDVEEGAVAGWEASCGDPD